MRYWIYWNDLVQGPFELDELSTLKALSEDLPVCLEDRTDWLPACRIADLAPIIEERRSSRMPPLPPPPPPTGRPAADPLQGEFFTEAPNQKWLFPDNDPSKGPFAFSPTQLEMKTVFPDVTFTAPIHFYGGGAAVATAPSTRSVLLMPERREEQDVRIPMTADIFPSKVSPVPELKEDIAESLATPRIALEIYPDTPEPATEVAPSELPPLSLEPSADRSTARIAAWAMGIFAALFLVGSLTFKWFDFSTSRAAINEAKKRMPGVKPLPVNTIAPVPIVEKTPAPAISEQDAIALVSNYPIPGINQTVGERVQVMDEEAADGKKAVWKAQLIKGLRYRVSLTFPAQPGAAARAYSFVANLKNHSVAAVDAATASHFLKAKKKLTAGPGITQPQSDISGKDAWQERQKDAIQTVMNKKIARTSQTIGEHAQAMVAQTQGQTRAIWDALQIKGSLYRVSLVLSSSQPGAADAMHLYPFLVNLKTHKVSSEDAETSAKFLKAPKKMTPQQNAENSRALPVAAIVPAPAASTAGASSTENAESWKNRDQEAKDLVVNKIIKKINQTVGERAEIMADQAPGQAKALWNATQTKGALYTVSLVLGNRLYPFTVDLKKQTVSTEDAATSAQFLKAKKRLEPKAPAPVVAAVPAGTAVPVAVNSQVAPASEPTPDQASENKEDPSKDRSNEAIDLVTHKKVSTTGQTVGERADILADQAPGQAKALWNATQIKGELYTVSLILANRLYPFTVDLKKQSVFTEDAATSAQFLKAKKRLEPSKASVPVMAAVPAGTVIPVLNSQATSASASTPALGSENKVDLWKERFKEAIDLATHKKITTTGQSVGERASVMLEGMHDKELLYAADTGQRLYLPDKIAWSALQESGPVYRIYLGFSADQSNGERTQTQSYQFQANLEHHVVVTDDAATAADFLNATTALVHKRDPRAADIQNVLSGVDLLNKQLMRAIIVKDNRKNRLEEKDIAAAIKIAMQRFQRAVIYFRSNYPDAMLQKIAQAYSFTKLLKDHV